MSDDLHLDMGFNAHVSGSESVNDLAHRVTELKKALQSLTGATKGLGLDKTLSEFKSLKDVADRTNAAFRPMKKHIAEAKEAFGKGIFNEEAKRLEQTVGHLDNYVKGIDKSQKLSSKAVETVRRWNAFQLVGNRLRSESVDASRALLKNETALAYAREKSERALRRRNGRSDSIKSQGKAASLFKGRLDNFANSMRFQKESERAANAEMRTALSNWKKKNAFQAKMERAEDQALKGTFNKFKYTERVKRNSLRLDQKLNPQQDAHMGQWLRATMSGYREKQAERERRTNLRNALKDERVRFSYRRHALETESEYQGRLHAVRRRARTKMYGGARHTASHLRHAVEGMSHPFFSSPAFMAEAGLVTALATLTHAIEESRKYDKELTNLRIRAGLSREETDERGRQARIIGSDYGVGAEELLKIQTEAASRGLPKDMVQGLGPTILKFSESIGQPAAEAADAASDFVQQLASMHKIKDLGEAHRTLNTAAKLSNRFGGGQRMLQAFENGLAERGAVLNLNPKDTLALGALFNASGARTGRTSVQAMAAFGEQAPRWKDKWLGALMGGSIDQSAQLMRKAPQMLGYGNIGAMQNDAMGKNGLNGILSFIQSFSRIKDEGSRRLLQQELGFTSEIAGIFEGILHSDKNVRDAKALSNEGWNEKDDKTDTLAKNQKAYRDSLTYTTDVIHTAFENIEIAVGEGMNRAVLLKLVKSFHGISVWSTYELPKIVDQMIHGFVDGLGFHGVGRLDNVSVMIKLIGDEIRKVNWRVVGTELAMALRGIGEGLRSVWNTSVWLLNKIRSTLSWFGLGGDGSIEAMAKLATEVAALALALHFLTPVIGVIGALTGGIMAIVSALQAAKAAKVLNEVAKNTKGAGADAAGEGMGLMGRVWNGIKGGSKALVKGGAVSIGVDLAGKWLMNKLLGWNDEKETKFNKVMEYPALNGLFHNMFGGGKSYSPSNADGVAKKAIISTEKGVYEVKDSVDKLGNIIKTSFNSGDFDRLGTGAGDGEGQKNIRYGAGGRSLPKSSGHGTGHDSGDRTHVGGNGPSARMDRNKYATSENADAIISAAKELGTTPEDLATVISYESAGSFSPDKMGGRGGRYQGLIQFGPPERKQFGVYKGQSFPDQMKSVVKYLKKRGYKPGMGLLDLYSTINAGSPGHYNASDGNGTVRSHVANMQKSHGAAARGFLHKSSNYKPAVGMASGGRVRGKGSGTSDSIPVMLSNGEFVVNAKSAAAHADLLHIINGYDAPGMSGQARRYLRWAKAAGGYSARSREATGTLPYSTADGWSAKALGLNEPKSRSFHIGARKVVGGGLAGLLDSSDAGWTKKVPTIDEINKQFDALQLPYEIGSDLRDANQKNFGGANLNDRRYGAKHADPRTPKAFGKQDFMPGIPAGRAADIQARKDFREWNAKDQLKEQQELNRLADESNKIKSEGQKVSSPGFELDEDLKKLMRANGIDPDTGKKISPQASLAQRVMASMVSSSNRSSSVGSNESGHTFHNQFHIHGAHDPQAVANAVQKHIQATMAMRTHDVDYDA